MEKEMIYYRCLVPDCKVKEVYDHFPTLVVHYINEHAQTPRPRKEEVEVKEIPAGYQLHISKKKALQTPPPPAFNDAPINPPIDAAIKPQIDAPPAPSDKKDVPSSPYKQAMEPTLILNKILDTYPGLDKTLIAEIMDWVELKGTLHPMEVSHLLSNMAGVPKGAADIIPQKYQLAMAKAAQEGQAEVQMALATWGGQMGGQGRGSFGPLSLIPGQGGNVMFPFGFYPNPYGGPWLGQADVTKQDHTESAADVERNKRLEGLEKNQTEASKTLEAILKKITETEEQKKEAALNARLDKLEGMIVEATSSPKTDETKDKNFEAILAELKETRTEMAKIKEDAAQAWIVSLEASVKALSESLQSKDRKKIPPRYCSRFLRR
jgi:hypothetical protein